MPNKPHQTTPFRRPSNAWVGDPRHDPADMGTEYGLEMRLEPGTPDAGILPDASLRSAGSDLPDNA